MTISLEMNLDFVSKQKRNNVHGTHILLGKLHSKVFFKALNLDKVVFSMFPCFSI